MSDLIRSISKNTKGDDYICSDIHGHYSLLKTKLNKAGFDPSVDRLFCLGDLIDRGPESLDALKWLEYDWFYAIQGNHERMLIHGMEGAGEVFLRWLQHWGSWAIDLDRSEFEQYYQSILALPLAIELELPEDRKVALVHAELPDKCDWHDIVESLSRLDRSEIDLDDLASDMLWQKSQVNRGPDRESLIEPVKNIDHVFHGHTIVQSMKTIGNRTFMDLGSYVYNDIGLVKPKDFSVNRP